MLVSVVGLLRAERLTRTLVIEPTLLEGDPAVAPRAVVAQALNMLLFEITSSRVSIGARAYVRDRTRRGERILLDHGAVRTFAGPSGELPAGEEAITRLLLPLGYVRAGEYPIGDRFTGRAYRHVDFPATISQFFVSEMHPDPVSASCRAALQRVVGAAKDPLDAGTRRLLADIGSTGRLPIDDAAALLRGVVSCFDRHHDEPSLADYETLLKESRELAWFATEGSVFNHFTDRVDDVAAVVEEQTRHGRAMKREIEVSASGRIAQTSFETATVERLFVDDQGALVPRLVPGVFQELISRREISPGEVDLAFDASNAEKLLAKMTQR